MLTKNLIFDVDGTLWDATHEITIAYNKVIREENAEYPVITVELMASIMGMLLDEIATKFFPYLSENERMKLIKKCCDNENEHLKSCSGLLYPHVEEVLATLSKTHHLYIVSNCQDGYIESLFAGHPIAQYFKDTECSGRTNKGKGDNIKLIMERNQMKDAIYIGDTQKDKDACDQAGIPFIYASYGFGQVDGYTEKIDAFHELLDLFACS